jgi:hypothetical protein
MVDHRCSFPVGLNPHQGMSLLIVPTNRNEEGAGRPA